MKTLQQIGLEKSCEVQSPSPLEGLRRQKTVLQQRLDAVNAAIKAFEANPGIEEVLALWYKAQR